MKESGNVIMIDISKDQEFLLISDVHFDNPKCDRVLFKQHLDQALAKNAIVLINGDFFCLMQGRYDPRGSKRDIRPEYLDGDYIDLVIKDAAEFLAPYVSILRFFARGNHETNIQKRLETDPLQRLADLLMYNHNGIAKVGGYGGWIIIRYSDPVAPKARKTSYKIKYFHGNGGGGIVTKGTINHQRFDASIEGADMIWMGHIHDQWEMTLYKEALDIAFNVIQKEIRHVQTPSYKNEYADGAGGWHIERGAPPKPLGGYWFEVNPVRYTKDKQDYIRINTKIYNT